MRKFHHQHSIPTPHTLPDHRVIQALTDLTDSQDMDYSKFCEAAESEPLIITQIMRAARAIRAGRENGVDELRHAVALIGLRRVREILEKIGRDISKTIPQ